MPDPTLLKQLRGIIQALMAMISLGLIVSATVAYYQALRYGWVKRPPERTIPGIIELGRLSYVGHLPEFAGSVAGLIGGLALYVVLGFVVVMGSFVSVLAFGISFPVQDALHMAVALSLVYTIAVQNEIREKISQSKWYLGYSSL